MKDPEVVRIRETLLALGVSPLPWDVILRLELDRFFANQG
jgi:hypothetical protein